MNDFSSLFKKEHISQLILSILFIIYLILGFKTPKSIAKVVDSVIGKTIIFFIVVYMFIYSNPILAVLSLFVAFDLIRRSTMATGSYAMQMYMPSEVKKTF